MTKLGLIAFIILSSISATARPDQEARDCIDQFKDVEGKVKEVPHGSMVCNAEEATANPLVALLEDRLGPRDSEPIDYFRKTSCDDLFRQSPPAWVPNEIAQATPWNAVCSLYWIKEIQRGNAPQQLNSASVASVLARIADESDACPLLTPTQKGPAALPIQPPSKPPAVPLLSQTKRKELFHKFLGLRPRIAKMCCYDGHPSCRERMEKLSIRWCEYKDGKWFPESCKEGGGAAAKNRSLYYHTVPLFGGRIEPLGVLAEESAIYLRPQALAPGSDEWQAHQSALAHELGHACSHIRRRIMASSQEQWPMPDPAYFKEWAKSFEFFDKNGNPTKNCEIGALGKSIYQSLFLGFGASKETFRCVLDVAERANKTSRLGLPCKGCPQAHIEEAFADWIRLSQATDDLGGYSMIHRHCDGLRDGEHPGAETISCFVKTASVRRSLKRGLKCL